MAILIPMTQKDPHPTTLKIVDEIIVQLGKDFDKGPLSKKQLKFYEDELSRVTLFTTLFEHELEELKERSPSELSEIFR